MSSREPLWFCHACDEEMRPRMVPHPVCARCQSDFVEKMENPNDDPREFTHGQGDYDGADYSPGVGTFLFDLQHFVEHAIGQGSASPRTATWNGTSRNPFSLQPRSGGSGSRQTSDRLGPDRVPTMSEYLGGTHRAASGDITGPLMAQYIMAALAQRGEDNFLGRVGFGNPAMTGRMGDYVFNQEALDQIITQLMNESHAHRPVPAPEDVVSKLPREVLGTKSLTLEKDCAVCKEQFKLGTEDPAEQIVITLPCTHPFHEPCILPWLKSSGTCPVCRYALVAQPDQHSPTPASDSNLHRQRPTSPSSNQSGFSRQEHDFHGIWQSLFGRSRPSTHTRSNSDSTTRPRSRNDHLPGGWDDDLD